jgi:hypothetical protein
MGMQSSGGAYESDSMIPFAPKNAARDNADQLDQAGQTILKLLHKAAGVAEANGKNAHDMAPEALASASLGRRSDRRVRG